eukprot:m.55689 g.55689  ORF g.55689 m.55689 type:complete len:600 (+) comp11982_c2_seq1:46-1845(+)
MAERLKAALSLPEGPGVEEAMYAAATIAPGVESPVAVGSWVEAVAPFHAKAIDDQFMPPIVRVDAAGKPIGTVKEGDSLVYWDFRTDRAKPLTSAFIDIPFAGQVGGLSDKATVRPKINMCTMTHYDDSYCSCSCLSEAFNPAAPLSETYAEVVGAAGVKQLIVAESEKWRAVTWFKDGRRNLGYQRESDEHDIITEKHPHLPVTVKIVRSRKVAAHIQAPQMRAKEIADLLLEGVESGVTDMFANFANSDMVGHAMTQIDLFDGVVEAVLELDRQLERLVPAALAKGYTVLITADHGNAEEMLTKKGQANPAHTTNKVPLILLGLTEEEKAGGVIDDVTISNVGPTTLALRGLPKPAAWDCESVLKGTVAGRVDRKIMRLVLDGYGLREAESGNAMAAAAKKKGAPLHMDRWMAGQDGAVSMAAEASGEHCGYPAGEAGTTEFGHVLFDAGRHVRSDLLLIDYAITSKKFFENPALIAALKAPKEHRGLHAMGILSDGKVHASLEHVEALLQLCQQHGLKGAELSIHVITDGRDVPGDSSPKYLQWLEEKIKQYGVGQVNSIWGRGWGKDRDNRWMRIEAAYRSLVEGTAAVHVQLPH